MRNLLKRLRELVLVLVVFVAAAAVAAVSGEGGSAKPAKPGWLEGRVRDQHNRAVSGVTVVAQAGAVACQAVTDGSGKYSIESLAAGVYQVAVDVSGTVYRYDAGAQSVSIRAGKKSTLDLDVVKRENAAPVIVLPGPADLTAAAYPYPIVIEAKVADDGLPLGASLQHAWSMIDGPAVASLSPVPDSFSGTVLTSDAASGETVRTLVTLPASGTYTLSLYSHDSALGSQAQMTVTVVDSMPVIDSAWADSASVLLRGATRLQAIASDPAGLPVTLAWSLTSGPADVEFVLNGETPVVAFHAAGLYEFEVTADNGLQTSVASTYVECMPGSHGQVAVEAESFQSRTDRGAAAWTTLTDADAAGGVAMQALPDSEATVSAAQAVEAAAGLHYTVQLPQSGVYFVWVRGKALNNKDDSCHIGLDGQAPSTAADLTRYFASYGSYAWSNRNYDGSRTFLEAYGAGEHSIDLWVREDGFRADKIVVTTDASWTPSDTGPLDSRVPEAAAFEQALDSAGRLVFEAEQYHERRAPGQSRWLEMSSPDASLGVAMQALPNSNLRVEADAAATDAAELLYRFSLEQAGTYALWLRGRGPSFSDDSCHVGIDGVVVSGAIGVTMPSYWGWSDRAYGQPRILLTLEPGEHTLHLWMREDGCQVDKILLTPDLLETPTGLGSVATHPLARNAFVADADGVVRIEAEACHESTGRLLTGATPHGWLPVADEAASGGLLLQALPNASRNINVEIEDGSPSVSFRVRFDAAGDYRLWLRGRAAGGMDDSVHAGLDGEVQTTATACGGFYPYGNFIWASRNAAGASAVLHVPSAGEHDVTLWMREDGLELDALQIVADPEYVPAD